MAKQLTAELPFGRVSNQRLYFVNGKLSTVHLIETPGAYFKEAVVLYTKQTGVFFFLIVSTVSSKRCIFWRTFEHKPLLGHVIYISIFSHGYDALRTIFYIWCSFPYIQVSLGNWETKQTLKYYNLDLMLEYWYIVQGQLQCLFCLFLFMFISLLYFFVSWC